MNIAFWAIGGGARESSSLPPEAYCGDYFLDNLPHPANFQIGQWIECRFEPGRSIILIRVEIPFMPHPLGL